MHSGTRWRLWPLKSNSVLYMAVEKWVGKLFSRAVGDAAACIAVTWNIGSEVFFMWVLGKQPAVVVNWDLDNPVSEDPPPSLRVLYFRIEPRYAIIFRRVCSQPSGCFPAWYITYTTWRTTQISVLHQTLRSYERNGAEPSPGSFFVRDESHTQRHGHDSALLVEVELFRRMR